ncbi:glycosyltransferase family 2 protein [Thermaurantimonas aggregans]|uniref:glycosyltransferase family 2 protein n=1 Tax=Thermaurantimonas aggregans TaxID=2173829 RepID=UPI0023F1BC07|nr:glycosyltransferase family A protein [Thermaurantimonas aggregans]MCX8148584.1 glycosyltransferase family 2 protein [Thermaurantimonas aggregans]
MFIDPHITLIGFNSPNDLNLNGIDFYKIDYNIFDIFSAIEKITNPGGYTVFWDFKIGLPNLDLIREAVHSRGDIWHGFFPDIKNKLPIALNYIHPCWILNLTSNKDISFISWRFDFRSTCLKNDVFIQLGNISKKFINPDYAAYEFGYRCISSGVIPVYLPSLNVCRKNESFLIGKICEHDELVFLRLHSTRKWINWFLFRTISTGKINLYKGVYSYFRTKYIKNIDKKVYTRNLTNELINIEKYKISVIIITLGRYEYLKNVIQQLQNQNIPIHEIIIVDANPEFEKVDILLLINQSRHNIPVKIIHSKIIGQCTQRNIGIEACEGDYILFMDDDMDEIPSDHIYRHLLNFSNLHVDVSCGVPDEVLALPVSRKYPKVISDVFPTNDSLVRKDILNKSGLFDVLMDRGQSEDHELGIRIYLAGALMIKDSTLRTLHLRASSGGLRKFGNRKITYSSSRLNILHRRLPHVTELYLKYKHFQKNEVLELNLISILGTFSIIGNWRKKLLKVIVAFFLLPYTIFELSKRNYLALKMIKNIRNN